MSAIRSVCGWRPTNIKRAIQLGPCDECHHPGGEWGQHPCRERQFRGSNADHSRSGGRMQQYPQVSQEQEALFAQGPLQSGKIQGDVPPHAVGIQCGEQHREGHPLVERRHPLQHPRHPEILQEGDVSSFESELIRF